MELMDLIRSAQGGNAIGNLASRFGLNEDQVSAAVSRFVPALAGGLQQQAAGGGLGNIISAAGGTEATKYADDESTAHSEEAVNTGNNIVDQLLGGQRQEAVNQAAEASGVSHGVLHQMLPLVATMAVGVLAKHGGQGGLMGMAESFLNRNEESESSQSSEGSGGLLGKFFKR